MHIYFVRHGESRSNAKQIQASDPDKENGLTERGVMQINEVAKVISGKISAIHASPYMRTLVSANTFAQARRENLGIIIDDRLREIDYGEHINQKDHPEMEYVAEQQIAGNYEIRFGKIGENKREILTRFYSFLTDVLKTYPADANIVVFSHGRAISMLEEAVCRLKNVKKKHVHTDNGTIKELLLGKGDVDLLEINLKAIGRGK